jgi:hypothetical protein
MNILCIYVHIFSSLSRTPQLRLRVSIQINLGFKMPFFTTRNQDSLEKSTDFRAGAGNDLLDPPLPRNKE